MLEWLSLGFMYSVLKDSIRALRGRRGQLSPSRVLELRQKWKPLFDEEIWTTHTKKLSKDIIIRDVKRLDNYPNGNNQAKGISPWFRASLLATYHKGILVGLRAGELKRHADGDDWRYIDYRAGERGDVYAILIGRIPFENIEAVGWNGDEYYYYPHIYCYFDSKRKEPYEDLVFCVEKCNPGSPPFYVEIASYDKVRELSKKLGIETQL